MAGAQRGALVESHGGGGPVLVPGLRGRRGRRRRAAAARACAAFAAFALGCGETSPPVQPETWQEGEGYRWRELAVPERGEAGFRALPPTRTGVSFRNVLGEERLLENQILSNGSGVAIGDVDGDGRPDLYLARLEGPNALYRNLGGWRFEEVAAEAGVVAPDRFSTGAVLADADGDGDLDLVLTSLGGPTSLFLNDGRGRFEEEVLSSGSGATTSALADVDGDGDLDLYVTNYKRASVLDLYPPEERTLARTTRAEGGRVTLVPEFEDHYELTWRGADLRRLEVGEPDHFYVNGGDGRFRPVPLDAGRFLDASGRPLETAPRDWGLSARFEDLDGDGDPDLYVCNDFQSPDRIWWNDGSGTFRTASPLAVRTTSATCMDVDAADVDRDGDVDLFTVDMLSRDPVRRRSQVPVMPLEPTFPGEVETVQQAPRNALLLSRGDGTFAEVAHYAGVAASEWSWAALFLDVDLDGFDDILVPNGHLLDFMDADAQVRGQTARFDDWRRARLLFPELRTRNVAFRNEGGLRFREVGRAWGFGPEPDISHGIAAGDLDGDGDLDIVVNRLGAPALLLRNESPAPRVAVRLEGRPPNTRGVGAVIRIRGGPVREQRKSVAAGGTYLSGSEPLQAFAADGSAEMTLTVEWPAGGRSRVEAVRANRLYVVREPETTSVGEPGLDADREPGPDGRPAAAGSAEPSPGSPRDASPGPADRPLFEEVELEHLHVDAAYDDFRRQPLLPLRLSQLGPGVTWHDLDGDGDPDLVIGSGRGGTPGLFRNDGGTLERVSLRVPPAPLDQTTILGVPGPGGGTELLVGQMNYEAGDPSSAREAPAVLRLTPAPGAMGRSEVEARLSAAVPGAASAAGPLALADYDGDGDLDLFVGGRVVPAAYPEAASSRLFLRDDDGRFAVDRANRDVLEGVGLVSAAAFSDVDGDGDPDLLLALEWGPLLLLENEDGRYRNATSEWGLAERTGRWNGIATGDLDGNGRPDLVATAWGGNTGLPASPERPLRVYYGDLDADGTLDVLQAAREEGGGGGYAPLAPYDRVREALPYVAERIPSYTAYARAGLGDLLGRGRSEARIREAAGLEHLALLNRGGRFEPVPLPPEAQFAPAFGAVVADFDGDGHEDLFLAQNFFATDPWTPRYDAGRGLLLRGDGSGRLLPVPAAESGVRVYGEGRGAAAADFDADGRLDLVVAQNAGAARLFRNRGARPGLRVRLVGRPENPHAVGAAVRVVYPGGRGPLREVKAGSGYWSQDGPAPVLGLRKPARAVWVRWPDGRESEHPVPVGTRELILRAAP